MNVVARRRAACKWQPPKLRRPRQHQVPAPMHSGAVWVYRVVLLFPRHVRLDFVNGTLQRHHASATLPCYHYCRDCHRGRGSSHSTHSLNRVLVARDELPQLASRSNLAVVGTRVAWRGARRTAVGACLGSHRPDTDGRCGARPVVGGSHTARAAGASRRNCRRGRGGGGGSSSAVGCSGSDRCCGRGCGRSSGGNNSATATATCSTAAGHSRRTAAATPTATMGYSSPCRL